MGCDFESNHKECQVELPDGICPDRYFLIVGTIEPRKNHKTLFSAYDSYRKAGGEWGLVVVGREGWNCDDIIRTMHTSPWFGLGLTWFSNASDELLDTLYKGAGTLVIPSYVEGFGLPLIEGAHWGCSIISSDIPVFREIGESFANFFSPNDASQLSILMTLAEKNGLPLKVSESVGVGLTWEQSSTQFTSVIEDFIRSSIENEH